jgi:prephenate dehydrogenase
LGVGLLGGSIGLAAKSSISGCKIIGYGHRTSTLDAALARKAIDQAFTRPEDAVRDCDLVILCTPVGMFGQLLDQIAPALMPEALVTDVGSTKRSVVQWTEQHLPNPGRFVGSHPIAGSEKRGIQFARPDLFANALCLTTPTALTNPQAVEAVESFWRLLGMRLMRLTPEEHDSLLAEVSHLPHALAAVLATIPSDKALSLCGKGFLDATRIAAGDPGLWRDIFMDNRDNLQDTLRATRGELDILLSLLETGNADAVQAWLAAAAARRQALDPPPR